MRALRAAGLAVAAVLILTALWRWGEVHQTPVDAETQRGIDWINAYPDNAKKPPAR